MSHDEGHALFTFHLIDILYGKRKQEGELIANQVKISPNCPLERDETNSKSLPQAYSFLKIYSSNRNTIPDYSLRRVNRRGFQPSSYLI